MKDSVRAYWLTFNEPLESRLAYMYLDIEGFVTTGVGDKIDATKAPLTAPTDAERTASHAQAQGLAWLAADGTTATADQVAAAWDLVKSRFDLARSGGTAFRGLTDVHLGDDEIDRVVFAKLDQMEAQLGMRTEFAGYADWPADAQLGLLSMTWAMGPGFAFPRFQGYVQAGDWQGAAAQCRMQPDTGGVKRRNDQNQQLFTNAAAVVAGGLDPDTLVFPGTVDQQQ